MLNIIGNRKYFYAISGVLIGAAVLGWLLGAKDRSDHSLWAAGMMWGSLLASFAIYVWEQLLAQPSGYYQFQGRYLFPIIIPFAFLLVGGWARMIAPQRHKLLIGAAVSFLAVFDMWCVVGYLVPLYWI